MITCFILKAREFEGDFSKKHFAIMYRLWSFKIKLNSASLLFIISLSLPPSLSLDLFMYIYIYIYREREREKEMGKRNIKIIWKNSRI